MQKKSNKKVHISEKKGRIIFVFPKLEYNHKSTLLFSPSFQKILKWNVKEYNRSTSRFEARSVYKQTQKPNFLITTAR